MLLHEADAEQMGSSMGVRTLQYFPVLQYPDDFLRSPLEYHYLLLVTPSPCPATVELKIISPPVILEHFPKYPPNVEHIDQI